MTFGGSEPAEVDVVDVVDVVEVVDVVDVVDVVEVVDVVDVVDVVEVVAVVEVKPPPPPPPPPQPTTSAARAAIRMPATVESRTEGLSERWTIVFLPGHCTTSSQKREVFQDQVDIDILDEFKGIAK